MADVYEQNLAQKSSLTTSDYIRVVGSDNVSYKQGMRNTIDTIVGNSTVALPSSITDLNDIDTTSIYTIGATVPTNAPRTDGTWSAYVQTFRQSATYKFQVYVFFGTTSEEVYYRKHFNGTWRDWVKQPTRAEVDDLKTVNVNDYSAFVTAFNASSVGAHLFTASGTLASTLTGGRVTVSIRGLFDRSTKDFLFSDGGGQLYTMRISAFGDTAPTVGSIRKATMTSIL